MPAVSDSEKTGRDIGCQNLAKLNIADAISEAQAERSARIEITQDMVLTELAKKAAKIRWDN